MVERGFGEEAESSRPRQPRSWSWNYDRDEVPVRAWMNYAASRSAIPLVTFAT